MASVGAPRRTLAQSGLGCPNGSTLPGRPIDRPLVCSGEERRGRRFPRRTARGTPMLSQTGRGRDGRREGEAGRSRPTDRPTAVANTIELPPSNVEEVNTSIRSLGTPLQIEIVKWTCGVVSCNFAPSPGKIKKFLNSVLIIPPLILIQIALSPRMYVAAGAGVGVVGGDRDERAEERDGPAERAATDRQPGRLQSAEGRGRKGRLDGRVAARSSA